jgi:hypothetical protein
MNSIKKAVGHPQRLNNLLELFFRGLRRDHRRKTGFRKLIKLDNLPEQF